MVLEGTSRGCCQGRCGLRPESLPDVKLTDAPLFPESDRTGEIGGLGARSSLIRQLSLVCRSSRASLNTEVTNRACFRHNLPSKRCWRLELLLEDHIERPLNGIPDFGKVIAHSRGETGNGDSRRAKGPIDQSIASPAAILVMALVIEFNHADNRQVPGVAHDKIHVLADYTVESGLPPRSIVRFYEIGDTHFAEHSVLGTQYLVQDAQE